MGFRALVPETAVDEDGEPDTAEDEVRATGKPSMQPISTNASVPQGATEPHLKSRDAAVRLHCSESVVRARRRPHKAHCRGGAPSRPAPPSRRPRVPWYGRDVGGW